MDVKPFMKAQSAELKNTHTMIGQVEKMADKFRKFFPKTILKNLVIPEVYDVLSIVASIAD